MPRQFAGPRPLKQIKIRIIPAEGHAEDKQTFHAPPGRHYTDESIEHVVEKVIEHLDKKYPWWEFRMVKVGRGQYNFVYDGLREEAIEKMKGKSDDTDGVHGQIEN